MRCLLLLPALLLAPLLAPPSAAQQLRVTLLGTGSPAPLSDRFGPATLVEAGDQTLLFDAGRGVVVRLWQAGVPVRDVDAVLLTHFHHDHINGLADLWLTGWLRTEYGQNTRPLLLIGPAGAADVAGGLDQAYARNVEIRLADERLPETAASFAVQEFSGDEPVVVYEEGGVRVRAFPVDHGALITPAVGYRVDYAGLSVVLSGDTTYDERLIDTSRNVDLLVHEVMAWDDTAMATVPGAAEIAAHHTSPEEAGRLFALASPKLAAFSHLVLRGVSPEVLEARTRTTYDGPLAIGVDLLRFVITRAGVAVEAGR